MSSDYPEIKHLCSLVQEPIGVVRIPEGKDPADYLLSKYMTLQPLYSIDEIRTMKKIEDEKL